MENVLSTQIQSQTCRIQACLSLSLDIQRPAQRIVRFAFVCVGVEFKLIARAFFVSSNKLNFSIPTAHHFESIIENNFTFSGNLFVKKSSSAIAGAKGNFFVRCLIKAP